MATTVDTLLVRIEADLKGLKRDLNGVSRTTDRTTKQMSRSFDKVNSSLSKTGRIIKQVGAVIAAGFVLKSVINTSASFEDLQLTLNTVFKTAEAGEAAFSFINEFAQRTPFDIQTLTKAFIQLGGAGIKPTEELLTTFGDAASATTNRIAAFEAMVRIATRAVGGGLGLEELEQLVNQGIPVYKILQDEIGITRTEISEMGQTAEGAAKIMNALQTGLNKNFGGGMQRASKNLSVALSNLGIAGTDISKTFGDAFNDSLTDLANTASRLLNNLKPLASFLGSILSVAIEAVNLALRGLNAAIELLADAINFIRQSVFSLNEDLFSFLKPVEGANEALSDLEKTLGKNIEAMDKAAPKFEKSTKILQGLRDENKLLTMALQNRTAAEIELEKVRQSMQGTPEEQAEFKAKEQEIKKLIAANQNAKRVTAQVKSGQELAKSTVESFATEEENLREKLDAVSAAMRGASEEDLPLYQRAIDGLNQKIMETNPQFQAMKDAAEMAADGISDALADAFVNGKFSLESLGDVFKQVIKQMIADAIKVTGFFGGGGSVGSGSTANTFTSAPDSFASGGRIPTRASGGPVLVGERGPELFIPHSGGVVRNNHDTKNMLGGGSPVVVNQNINIDAGVSQTVRAEVMSMMPRIKSETIQAMIDGKRRGNSISKAFA